MSIEQEIYSSEEIVNEFLGDLTFGEFLESMRETDNITQVELARRIGKTKQFIHSIESGKSNVSFMMAKRLAEALDHFPEPFIEVLANEMLRRVGISEKMKFEPKKAA
ncbi:MAG: helix-turn-helix transcriptional regulator [Bdellovibrionota bacterium]